MLETAALCDEKGKIIRRAYSIGTTNQQMQDEWTIGTIVKKNSLHGMSAYLTQIIKLWDTMTMTWAIGHFIDPGHHHRYLFCSIGSWLTPIHAHYQKLIKDEKRETRIANIFGERNRDFLLDDIVQLFSLNNENIKNICFLSREEKNVPQWRKKGYVQAWLEEALHFLWNDEDIIAFLCGKPSMVDEMREKLLDAGIPNEQIVFEKY